jgi:hypothetical protein
MEKSEAEVVVINVLHIYRAIGAIDGIIPKLSSDIERHRVMAAVGEMLRLTREDLLIPIFRQFPELVPDEMS